MWNKVNLRRYRVADEEVRKDAKRWSDENDAQLKKINYLEKSD